MHRLHYLPVLFVLVCVALALAGFGTTVGPTRKPADPPQQRASGALVIASGGRLPGAVDDRFLDLADGTRARLVVIPTASPSVDDQRFEEHSTCVAWRAKAGRVESVMVLHTRQRARADEASFVRPLNTATGVWLGGGDQVLLIEAYRGTAVERALHDLLARGEVIGGTSAGAAVMSDPMIRDGKAVAEMGRGFGFLRGVIVDQHLSERDRLPRLRGAVERFPDCLGLGIDEETAVVVQGRTATVLGEGQVHVCLPGQNPDQVYRPGQRIALDPLVAGTTKSPFGGIATVPAER